MLSYSWGNIYDSNKRGLWSKDRPEDLTAAREGLDKNIATKIGDSHLDPFINQSYNELSNLPSSQRHKWWPWNNCKHEATNLVDKAKENQSSSYK